MNKTVAPVFIDLKEIMRIFTADEVGVKRLTDDPPLKIKFSDLKGRKGKSVRWNNIINKFSGYRRREENFIKKYFLFVS